MGQVTKIQWCDHTFNPWRGCTKVSPGCAHCYAEKQALRNPKVLGVWGDRGTRPWCAESAWREVHKWNAAAIREGVRRKVFCGSMMDVFEGRPELVGQRQRLWAMIEQTPGLDWLLLTKRPENMRQMMGWHEKQMPGNLWLGVTAENQEMADWRIPLLLSVPARVRFLSLEPLLSNVDLSRWINPVTQTFGTLRQPPGAISWVIVGGESGPKARPMHPDWARSARDQCQAAGVAFFFKQWGEWQALECIDPDWWNSHPNYGEAVNLGRCTMYRVGKAASGAMLDGREWKQFPEVSR